MAIRYEFNENNNFTGRATIKQKQELFALQVAERTEDRIRIKITFDRIAIEKECRIDSDEPKEYILDAFVLGEIQRKVLNEFRSEDEIALLGVPEGVTPEFRLKVVSRAEGSAGKILAATRGNVRLKVGSGDDDSGERDKGIFHPVLHPDLGGRIWQVSWNAQDDFEIFMCTKYFNKHHDDPILAAHIFPEIVRGIATGILLRHDSIDDIDDESNAGQWVDFIQQRLGMPLKGEEAANIREPDNQVRLEYVEEIVTAFTSQKWRDGKTLLEEFLK